MCYIKFAKGGDSLNERLKFLRKELNLSQEDFGKKVGVSNTAISKLEKAERNVTDQMILSICREFNVNEEWLRNGTGDMFIQLDREDEITAWLGSLANPNNDNEFIKKFIHMLSKLDVPDWKVLEKMALLMVEEHKKD